MKKILIFILVVLLLGGCGSKINVISVTEGDFVLSVQSDKNEYSRSDEIIMIGKLKYEGSKESVLVTISQPGFEAVYLDLGYTLATEDFSSNEHYPITTRINKEDVFEFPIEYPWYGTNEGEYTVDILITIKYDDEQIHFSVSGLEYEITK